MGVRGPGRTGGSACKRSDRVQSCGYTHIRLGGGNRYLYAARLEYGSRTGGRTACRSHDRLQVGAGDNADQCGISISTTCPAEAPRVHRLYGRARRRADGAATLKPCGYGQRAIPVAAALTFELAGSENMCESNPHVFVVGSGAELKIADQDPAVDRMAVGECVAV